MNLLPPETWSISVLQYLEGMDIDQYCLFLLDVSVNLKQLLIPSLQYGPAHESYEQLIQVRDDDEELSNDTCQCERRPSKSWLFDHLCFILHEISVWLEIKPCHKYISLNDTIGWFFT